MTLKKHNTAISIAGAALMLSFAFVSAAGALTTSCVGTPTTSNITWTASSAGGVAPVAFLWGNGSTSSVQTVAVNPGTYSMTIQVTDASSSIATSTCAATVVAPVATTTTSVGSDIQAQIQALLNQIAALKTQIMQLILSQSGSTTGSTTGTSTPPTVGCFQSGHDLGRGDRGDDVKELQQEMAHEDSKIFPPGFITGFFGQKTEEALKHFQKKFGVGTTTGFFGPMTRGHFRERCHGDDNESGDMHSMNSGSNSTTKFSVSVKHGDDEGGNRMASSSMMGGNHGENGGHGNNGNGNGRDDN